MNCCCARSRRSRRVRRREAIGADRPAMSGGEPSRNAQMEITRRTLARWRWAPAPGPARSRPALAGAARGRLVVAMSSDPGHLDPRVEAGVPGWAISGPSSTGPSGASTGRPIPCLVTKWEQMSPTTLRWTLRRGFKFHDGEEFTAESVKLASADGRPRRGIRRGRAVQAIREVNDPDRVYRRPHHGTADRPLSAMPRRFTAVSPKAFRELGDKFATDPVGAGPWSSSSTGRAST